MKKIVIIVHTPLGRFRSKEMEEEKDKAKELFKNVAEMGNYLTFVGQNENEIIFSKGVLQQSVFEIEEVD